MLIKSLVNKFIASLAIMVTCSFTVQAHTVMFGTSNGGAAGSVIFWMGTYTHGTSHPAEGSITINGSTTAFTGMAMTAAGAFPDPSLVVGDNLFWASASGDFDGSDSTWLVSNYGSTLAAVTHWQSALVTGLSTAGLYDYTISGMFTANWENIMTFESNWTGSLLVAGSSVTPPSSVNEPGTLALVAMSLFGAAFMRRRKKS
ncbi:PEP-CTERM sorting domain-containing protein [Alteromonas genovensis]|jgi:hypothetical protein|uniref:PEP-CTERM sorting domain-containing protein n=1 Tax=Alteromonas genovensis TaxID=471225 RepID=A0A6N9TA92_9ALTE|nr:PEP-CTERM sorting domain-containing protein [Alteromonas genovensis]NDW14041.1 PEP-CTERM sorting domain-containing protein [Alteromonas genovensis]